ncbi:uncharacterized protein LOC122646848 [Telopea speciosissima]|uniref:uncharacterized protein LOC122646848 n=1 Tax=Telopea speciosissima TaxID=54955 RepID=UPI001CC67BE5|nr:uncharacterized protein LOC122646848 [Telopea speciosissima]
MLKKMKRVAMDSSPSYMVEEDARARFKHQSLMQDYQELLKDTEALNSQLQRTKQKRSTLKAEVRFLRRRYKHLVAVQTPSTQAEPDPPRLVNPEIRGEPLSEKRNYRSKEALLPNNSVLEKRSYRAKEAAQLPNHTVFDLNQVSRGEDEEEFQVLAPMGMEKPPNNYLGPICGGDEQPADLNLAVCRDIGNGSSRPGKRKITWSDQVALKV